MGMDKQPHLNSLEAKVPRLYHYEKFCAEWLTKTLCCQTIRCSDPAKLNDPWDCKPQFDYRPMANDPKKRDAMLEFYRNTPAGSDMANQPIRQQWEQQVRTSPTALQSVIEDFSRKLEVEICKRRLYCLVPAPDSILMWSHYADHHRGICLEFHVVNALFLKAWKVAYCSEYPVWVPQDMQDIALDVILTKSKDWECEQEFRIVGTPNGVGHPLKLDGDYLSLPPRALLSVIVGCRGDYEAVRKIVNEHAPGLAVKRALRTPYHYSLTIEDAANSA